MNQLFLRFLHSWQSPILVARRALRRTDGNSMVELALLVSFFGAPMLAGTSEVAFLTYDSIEVTNAAHAGAMYGMISSTFAEDSSGVQAAAKAEAPDIGTTLTVTPTIYYACSAAVDGTQYSTQTAANTACSGSGNHSLEFIQVATNATIPSPFQFSGLPKTTTFGGISIMEVQE